MNSPLDDASEQSSDSVRIYFTDFFEVSPEVLESYGALNISLINDLPLFIDPFLLFDSNKAEYIQLHSDIIRYVKFLKEMTTDTRLVSNSISHWFYFPEVRQNWLGFSKTGNSGSGLGKDFAQTLQRNFRNLFCDFGNEQVTRGTHLEKLCLVEDGVGRDHLSDFTTNLIKKFLLEYTQNFAIKHINPSMVRLFGVDKVYFDYEQHRWARYKYQLPYFRGDFVLLTPKDILTKDEAWINRSELINNFEDIYKSMPNAVLRDQINEYFYRNLKPDSKQKERRELAVRLIEKFPDVLDYYIKDKEESGDVARNTSKLKVSGAENQFILQVRNLIDDYLKGSEFYRFGDSYSEALLRVKFLKDVIENKDGYRIFYFKGSPIKRESDLQILYRLTWFASSYDVNREVNNGRGPVDYKISKGSADSALVEFKLSSNSKLKQNLLHQVEVYEKASDTKLSIKAILFFSTEEKIKTLKILEELGLGDKENIILIDASAENKISASNVKI